MALEQTTEAQTLMANNPSTGVDVMAREQTTEVHSKASIWRLLSAYCEHKWAKILIGIICCVVSFGLGFLLELLICQKDACKCPFHGYAHQGHCYILSSEEKNWKDSQNFCILHNAVLAKITEEEMDFVNKLTEKRVFWIGLKREPDQPWKWLDGENATLEVLGNGGDCVFFNDGTAYSGRCSTEHHFICKKN